MILSVPGRVNLIGEHIDYHNLPVLPIAIQRRIMIEFQPRQDRRVHMVSAERADVVSFDVDYPFAAEEPGSWGNYVRAAAHMMYGKYGVGRGFDAQLSSDLPMAAGLSSSSALLIAMQPGVVTCEWHRAATQRLGISAARRRATGRHAGRRHGSCGNPRFAHWIRDFDRILRPSRVYLCRDPGKLALPHRAQPGQCREVQCCSG